MDQSINISINGNLIQEESSSSSSTTKTKLYSFFFRLTLIIVVLTLALVIIKYESESKSPFVFPDEAIRAICYLPNLSQNPTSCFNSISTLYYSRNQSQSWTSRNKINLSQIFIFSLYTSIEELIKLSSASKNVMSQSKTLDTKTVEALTECKKIFNYSMSQLNESLEILGPDPNEKILKTKNMVWQLQVLVGEAMTQMISCTFYLEKSQSMVVREVRTGSYKAIVKMKNSRGILDNVDKIMEMFYPGLLSNLGSLILEFDSSYVWYFFIDHFFFTFIGCMQLVMFYQFIARVIFSS